MENKAIERDTGEQEQVPQLRDRVCFVSHERGPFAVDTTGEIVAIDKTNVGNFRYRVRTDEIAPQTGERAEWHVYSDQGEIRVLERHTPKPTPFAGPGM